MQYYIIPSDNHATQALNHLEQGPDELLDDYIHHVSDLSKIYHTSDMSRISVEGTNHYAVVYGLNCRKLKKMWQDIKVCSGRQWINASGIYITRIWATAEPNSACQMC